MSDIVRFGVMRHGDHSPETLREATAILEEHGKTIGAGLVSVEWESWGVPGQDRKTGYAGTFQKLTEVL